jgi:periplasmic divalent cation tolerance protein
VSERVLVLSTVARAEDGERIGRALVERGLAACVNVVPGLVSIYRWKGAVEREEERLLLIKTRRERFAALREALVALHPYEVPEVLALPIEDGHAPYLQWLDENTRAGASE